ncbi:MAG: hypothetical protein QNJ72_14350 [Pleurocapsa sp. MO_226.B13]|nr:hypothetical protein [Pleurocapsa sp. MO_226.B13]
MTLFYSKFITFVFFLANCDCSQKIVYNLNRIDRFIDLIPTVVEFDGQAAIEFGKIQGELRKLGKPTGEIDALIAAIARARGDIFV